MAQDISRVPSEVDLELYAGDGIAIRFTVLLPDQSPYPLDGPVTSQIRTKRTDADPKVTWSVDSTDQATGVIVIALSGEETASLIPTGKSVFKGVWDLQYQADGAEPLTLLQGKVSCDADVTR